MQIAGVAARQIIAQLTDGFKEWQAFNVANRAADLDQHEVKILIALKHEVLDGVGHMGNDLHGGAEIFAFALTRQNVGIDAAGGDVVALVGRTTGEALIVPQIQIGFGTIVGDKDFAVLGGRHRARIDVEIGVKLAQANLVAARLQDRAERCRCKTFTQ